MKKFIAFTLAEVLVTLGIIGVVSAMTIPTLMKHHQKTVYVAQLKKAYSSLSQAIDLALTESNAMYLSETKAFDNGATGFFRNYFKTSQICSSNEIENCLGNRNNYKDMYGYDGMGVSFGDSENSACAILPDGITFCLDATFPESSTTWIDVNGKDGPNVIGRDLFTVAVKNTGEVVGNGFNNGFYDDETSSPYGVFISRIIKDGWKMDY